MAAAREAMRSATVIVLLAVAETARAQTPAGPELHVNTYTANQQVGSVVSMEPDGDFIVVWSSFGQDGSHFGAFGQRFAVTGSPMGGEFRINTYTTGRQAAASVAVGPAGDFIVAMASDHLDADGGIEARRFDSAGNGIGVEFAVNRFTTGWQRSPRLARAANGSFVVQWTSYDGSDRGIAARRFDTAGTPIGDEFVVNSYTTGSQNGGDIAMDAAGNFVVVWDDDTGRDGSMSAVFGQRFDAAGNRLGGEFQVNTTTLRYQNRANVSISPAGGFVVAWSSQTDLFNYDVLARRFDTQGNGIGSDFRVNTFTVHGQFTSFQKSVAHDGGGSFVVTWESDVDAAEDGSFAGVFAQRFDPAGVRVGRAFQVNSYTTGSQDAPSVACDGPGNFVVAWQSRGQEPGDAYPGIFAQRFGPFVPESLVVDTGDNRVLEPGETVDVRPTWANRSTAWHTLVGSLPTISGPPGAAYSIGDGIGTYGLLPPGNASECTDCYAVSVSSPPTRPTLHWDAAVDEILTGAISGLHTEWPLHVGASFTDVPPANPFYRFVETMLHRSITGGCGGQTFCPSVTTTREQMAVFVLVAKEGPRFIPNFCLVVPMFADVPVTSPFCRWIEELARRGVVAGCGGGNYCPTAPVSREQMAVFVLLTLDPAMNPPACAAPNLYSDVPETSPFCRWIEELTNRNVVTGCGGGNYCPALPVSREQMAVFISATFGLALYGP